MATASDGPSSPILLAMSPRPYVDGNTAGSDGLHLPALPPRDGVDGAVGVNRGSPESAVSPSSSSAVRRRRGSSSGVSEGGSAVAKVFRTPHCHHKHSCYRNVGQSVIRNFVAAFSVRAGISVLGRIIRLLRSNRPSRALSLEAIFSEQHLVYRVDAVRYGTFVGLLAGLYKGTLCGLRHLLGTDAAWQAAVAGGVAALSLVHLPAETRRTFALYLCVRALQALYNAAKARGMWHMWGSDWAHGDTLLFCVTSAQVMYAYVMRPETLPRSYLNFIVQTGPITRPTLDAARAVARRSAVDVDAITTATLGAAPHWHTHWKDGDAPSFWQLLVASFTGANNRGASAESVAARHALVKGGQLAPVASPTMASVGCDVLHPQNRWCTTHAVETWVNAFKSTAPMYWTYSVAPAIVLRLRKFLQSPVGVLWRCTKSAARSTAFIAFFNLLYMSTICAHRRLSIRDHKMVYYLAGYVASLSVLFEEKSKRADLALYVLPRALDSLYIILNHRQWLGSMPQGETALFAASLALVMACHQHEASSLGGLMRRIAGLVMGRT